MHFSGSPRPAGSSASPFGIILAPGSASAAVLPSRSCQISSAAADSPPDVAAARGFAPVTAYGGKGLTMLTTQPVCHGAFDGAEWLRQISCQDFPHRHFSTDSGRHSQTGNSGSCG